MPIRDRSVGRYILSDVGLSAVTLDDDGLDVQNAISPAKGIGSVEDHLPLRLCLNESSGESHRLDSPYGSFQHQGPVTRVNRADFTPQASRGRLVIGGRFGTPD